MDPPHFVLGDKNDQVVRLSLRLLSLGIRPRRDAAVSPRVVIRADRVPTTFYREALAAYLHIPGDIVPLPHGGWILRGEDAAPEDAAAPDDGWLLRSDDKHPTAAMPGLEISSEAMPLAETLINDGYDAFYRSLRDYSFKNVHILSSALFVKHRPTVLVGDHAADDDNPFVRRHFSFSPRIPITEACSPYEDILWEDSSETVSASLLVQKWGDIPLPTSHRDAKKLLRSDKPQPPVMERLEALLMWRDIPGGLTVLREAVHKSNKIDDFYTYLLVKIAFCTMAEDFREVEADLLRMSSVFRDNNELLQQAYNLILASGDSIGTRMKRIVYQGIVASRSAPFKHRLHCLHESLRLPDLARDEFTAALRTYDAMRGEEDIPEDIQKVFMTDLLSVGTRFIVEDPMLSSQITSVIMDPLFTTEAVETAEDLQKLRSSKNMPPELIVRLLTHINQYMPTEEAILKRREQIASSVRVMAEHWEEASCPLDELPQRYDVSNFQLSYHGLSSKQIFSDKSRFFRRLCPELNFKRKSKSKKKGPRRILFLSDFLGRWHSVFKDRHRTIQYLSHRKDEFDVWVGTKTDLPDDIRFSLGNVQHIKLPSVLSQARDAVAKLEPDAIVYCEIGMDPFYYFLAHMRLAPKQINTWGHSDTSGISTIDSFVSSRLYEIEGAQEANYSEELVLFEGLSTTYVSPARVVQGSARKMRAQFGFSDQVHLYLCPQSIFKLHPCFDSYLIGILDRDPEGTLVLFDIVGKKDTILARLGPKATPSVLARITFLPGLPQHDYINLIECADVMLDTYPFGGCNSSLEAFAVGTPVITQPGALLNTRFTTGFYKKMGIEELIAGDRESYIDLAVRVGTDPAYRTALREKILGASGCLFLEQQNCQEWAELLLRK